MEAERNADRPVLDVAQVAELERRIAAAGTSLAELMERAGAAVADAALETAVEASGRRFDAGCATKSLAFETEGASSENEEARGPSACARAAARERNEAHQGESAAGSARAARFVVLCGSGNNGGDGWVAARLLAERGFAVRVVTPRPPDELTAQPARDAALRASADLEACQNAQIVVAPCTEVSRRVEEALRDADVIVDAILGTGFSGESVRAPYDGWIRLANARRGEGARIVAADVPSGLSAQTGAAADPCIEADLTVTMIVQKTGLTAPRAARYCGEVRVAPLAPIDGLLEGLPATE